ncbi:hypothetical protein QZH47_00405 [Pseudomonas corrugata]
MRQPLSRAEFSPDGEKRRADCRGDGVWLTAPWIARMVFGVVLVTAVAAVLILR